MRISKLKPSLVIDADKHDEVIHFDDSRSVSNGKVVYAKYRQLDVDFNGNQIVCEEEYIRVKSLWCADLSTGRAEELVVYGQFDIENLHSSENYAYFFKVFDKDRDGRLGDADYLDGTELWRVSLENASVEFCLDCKGYTFHGYAVVSDKFVVFRSEDRLPEDATELIFVDISNRRTASLVVPNGECEGNFTFHFVADTNGNPTHLFTKRWVFEVEPSSPNNTVNCITWEDLLNQLHWNPFP